MAKKAAHGGKRKGAGRKPIGEAVTVPWSLRLDPATIVGYEGEAQRTGQAARELAREDLESGLARRLAPAQQRGDGKPD